MADTNFERLEGALRRVEQELHDVKTRLAKLEGEPEPFEAPPVVFEAETPAPAPVPPSPAPPIIEEPPHQTSPIPSTPPAPDFEMNVVGAKPPTHSESELPELSEAEPRATRPVVIMPTVGFDLDIGKPPQQHYASQSAPSKPKTAGAIERSIGEVIMPRLGGILVLLGLLFLVGLGISKGFLTPWVIFGLGASVSLAFIGWGLIKRNEREEFGQVLVGIGSCGLYIVFAGSYAFQHLYEPRVLVEMFFSLSLLNFGYSLWTKSRSFLAIGIIGGLAAAVMPTHDGNYTVNAILHIVIVAVASLVASRNRWTGSAMWLWLFSMLALFPLLASSPTDSSWNMKVGVLYVNTLMCAVAAGLGSGSWFDPKSVFIPCITVLAGLISYGIRGGYTGAAHLTAFGMVLLVLSLLFTHQEDARNRFRVSAAIILMPMAPMGCTALQAICIYSVLTIACAIGASTWRPRILLPISWVEFGLSIVAYLILISQAMPVWSVESCLIVTMMVALGVASWATTSRLETKNPLIISAVIVTWVLSTRLSYLMFAGSPLGWSSALSVAVGWMAFVFTVSLAARLYRSPELSIFAAFLSCLTMAYYITLIGLDALPFSVDLPVVLSSLLAFATSVYVYVATRKDNDLQSIVTIASVIGLPMFARLVWLMLHRIGVDSNLLMASTWLIASLVITGIGLWKSWNRLSNLSAVVLGIATLCYVAYFEYITSAIIGQETVLMSGFVVAVLGTMLVAQRTGRLTTEIAGILGSVFAVGFYGRLCYIWLDRFGVDAHLLLASTGLIATYTLTALGLWRRWPRMSGVSAAVLVAAGLGYLAFYDEIKQPIVGQETVLMLGFIMATIGVAYMTHRTKWMSIDSIGTLSSVFALGFFGRLCYIWLIQVGVDPILVMTTTWLIASLSITALGLWKRWPHIPDLSATVLGLAGFSYAISFESPRLMIPGQETMLMLGFLVATYGIAFIANRTERINLDTSGLLGSTFALIFYTRLLYIWLDRLGIGLGSSLTIAWLIAALLLAVFGARRDCKSWVALAWFVLIGAFGAYFSTITDFHAHWLVLESVLLTGMIVVTLAVVNASGKVWDDEKMRMSAGAFLCWWTSSRLMILWIVSLNVGLNFNFSVTGSWSVYSVIILAIGFALKNRILRYWSLSVIGLTVLKVLLFDIATLDTMVRVAAFILTGIALILMSTWYFRNRSTLD